MLSIDENDSLTVPYTLPSLPINGTWELKKKGNDFYIIFLVNNKIFEGEYLIDFSEYGKNKVITLKSDKMVLHCKKAWGID